MAAAEPDDQGPALGKEIIDVSNHRNRIGGKMQLIIGINVSLMKTLSFFLMYEILQGLPELLCKLFLAAKLSSILIFQHYFLIMKKKKNPL